jgi:hypothetical protein
LVLENATGWLPISSSQQVALDSLDVLGARQMEAD